MIRAFKKEDIQTVNEWEKAWGLNPSALDHYPETGFIVEEVCAGFLYKTDSSICFIDGYISNPKTEKEIRKKALDLVTEEIFKAGKEMGFKTCIAYTENPAVRSRCLDNNFKPKGNHLMLVKEF
jgi:poly-gamma-glutamate capsule biosynthesis protein CapA/YwtB (metallophosphatase superfamily)